MFIGNHFGKKEGEFILEVSLEEFLSFLARWMELVLFCHFNTFILHHHHVLSPHQRLTSLDLHFAPSPVLMVFAF
jgi:hypothetical protein